jgi:hypothetical protein
MVVFLKWPPPNIQSDCVRAIKITSFRTTTECMYDHEVNLFDILLCVLFIYPLASLPKLVKVC